MLCAPCTRAYREHFHPPLFPREFMIIGNGDVVVDDILRYKSLFFLHFSEKIIIIDHYLRLGII